MCLFPDTPPLQTALAAREHSWSSMPSLHSGAKLARRSVKDVSGRLVKDVMGLNTILFLANGGSLLSFIPAFDFSTHSHSLTKPSQSRQPLQASRLPPASSKSAP